MTMFHMWFGDLCDLTASPKTPLSDLTVDVLVDLMITEILLKEIK